MKKKLYTCMCCGFKVFEDVFSEYEVCPICNFQDNFGAIKNPIESYFTGSKSLLDQQQEILKLIPEDISEYYFDGNMYFRNLLWKPLNVILFDYKNIYFPKFKFEEFKEKYPKYYDHFEELMHNAQRHNPDEKVHLL